MVIAWVLLVAAIGVEVAATTLLPRSDGFRVPGWTAAVLTGYAVSIWFLALAVRHIPVSVSYAVWSGLGTVGIVVIGAMFLDERVDLVKAVAIGLIVVGVVVLNLHGAH